MIKLVLGVPGSGKSLYMLWLMQQYVNAGRKVFTNMELTPACPFYHKVFRLEADAERLPGFDHLALGRRPFRFPVMTEPDKDAGVQFAAFWNYVPRGAAIFLDEGDNYFDSADWDALSVKKENRLYWKQHRKAGHDVIFTLQHLENLYIRVRRQVQSWIVCEWNRRASRAYSYLPIWASAFNRVEFASEKFSKASMMGNGRFWYAEAKKMFTWYRSDQIIGDFVCAGARKAAA